MAHSTVHRKWRRTGPLCPQHMVPMKLLDGRFGPFFGCPHYPDCDWIQDAANPRAMPSNKDTREARVAAHYRLDAFWKIAMSQRQLAKHEARGRAYEWLAEQLEMAQLDCHIELFDVETCERVVAITNAATSDDIYGYMARSGDAV